MSEWANSKIKNCRSNEVHECVFFGPHSFKNNAFHWLPAFKENKRCHKIIQISDFSRKLTRMGRWRSVVSHANNSRELRSNWPLQMGRELSSSWWFRHTRSHHQPPSFMRPVWPLQTYELDGSSGPFQPSNSNSYYTVALGEATVWPRLIKYPFGAHGRDFKIEGP